MLERHLTHKIPLKDFQFLLISCSKWYIHLLSANKDLTGRKIRPFQNVLCLAFDRFDENDLLIGAVRPVVQNYLKKQRLQQSRRGTRYQAKFISVDQLKKEPFALPQFQHKERGLVLVNVLTDIYDWMTEYTSPNRINQSESYDLPYFDILAHAKKAKVIFKEKKSEKDRLKPVPVPQYTRTVTWILRREITSREKAFLTTTKNLQSINVLGMNALELINFIRDHLMIEYTKIRPNKKRRVLVFTPTSNLIDERINQQIRKMDFTCGCCIYLSKYTKIDCLLFKKLEYLASLKHKTIPANLKSLYAERINPIFSTKVACFFLSLRKTFTIQLKKSKKRKMICVACLGTLDTPSSLDIKVSCSCNTEYSVISPEMTENSVFHCQLIDQHTILTKHDQSDRLISTLTKQEYIRTDRPELPPYQVFQPEIDKINRLKLLFREGSGYIHIFEDDSIYYDRKRRILRVNQISYQLNSLKLIDTEKWNPVLQSLADKNPFLEFNCRFNNINLSREDKVTIIKNKIPFLQIKRPRKKEMETYPLHRLQTVYNVGKPRLNKIFKKWRIRTINSSIKGILKEPNEEIKEAIELPGVRHTLQQLHIQGLMISHMNATYYLMELARIYEKKWLADRYKFRMNKLLPRCPTRLEDYYNDAQIKSFRQVSALEAWFSRPFAEGVRQFIIVVQGTKNLLIQRPYGRTVARRVNKTKKQGVDYMGGYTSFDAMMNCVNRRLRHQLRIWNAKAGLGFKTIPLFVHTASDKAGRAGHLDLEEVGRIISRLTLCEAIAEEKINPFQFQRRYDDDYLPYYVLKEQIVRWLRGVIVKKHILPKKLFYLNQWLSFEVAHKYHVKLLCSCLEQCVELTDFDERVFFLRETYQPLIFHPNFEKVGASLE